MSRPAAASRRQALALIAGWASAISARAHGFKAGAVRIEHPYAPPTLAGTGVGAVYFRRLVNEGTQPDRLVQALTDAAATVEFHRMVLDSGVMRMRAVDHIDLPPGVAVPIRHDQHDGHHLMLRDLKAPLREGDRFTLRLRLERAGWTDVVVWVQNPRKPAAHTH